MASEICSRAQRHRSGLARPEAASPRPSDVQGTGRPRSRHPSGRHEAQHRTKPPSVGQPPKSCLAHPSIAPYGVFTSKDGKSVLISIQNEREWVILCERVMREPSLSRDPRFASNVARVQNRGETDERVSAGFAALDATELIDRLNQADIAFAVVNEITD